MCVITIANISTQDILLLTVYVDYSKYYFHFHILLVTVQKKDKLHFMYLYYKQLIFNIQIKFFIEKFSLKSVSP